MATPAYAAPIALQDNALWAVSTGSPTYATSGLRSGGGDAKLVCAAVGSPKRNDYAHPGGTRVTVDSIYVRYGGTPSANASIFSVVNASGNIQIIHRTTAQFRMDVGATSGPVSITPPVAANTWFRLDVMVVVSGGTTTASWWIDGVAQTPTAGVQADADLTASRIGIASNTTVTWEYMDHIGSYTQADAPLGAFRQRLLDLATVVGANHNLGSGAFQKTGAVAITSGDSTSQAELTEHPFAGAQFVAQTVADAAAYVEYPVADTAETVAPTLVRVGIAYTGAAANAYTMEVRAHDGTSEGTDLTTGVAKTSTTLHPLYVAMASPPSGGAWTLAKLQALKFRFGFSSDATPDPQLYGLAVLAVFPAAASVTGAFALTASPSLAFTGQRTRLAAFALVASPSLAFSGVRTRFGAFALVAAPSLSFAGVRTRLGGFALTASAALSATGVRERLGAFGLTATATLAATGGRVVIGAYSLTASSTLVATGVRTRLAAFALSASATLQATGQRTALGAFALSVSSSLIATGQRTALGAFNLVGQGALSAAGQVTRLGAFALTAIATLTAHGIKTWPLDNAPGEDSLTGHASERTLDGDPAQSPLDNDPDW